MRQQRHHQQIQKNSITRFLVVIGAAGVLTACVQTAPVAPPTQQFGGSVQPFEIPTSRPAHNVNSNTASGLGRVTSIDNITPRPLPNTSSTSGAGAAVGAVVGGVLGNQIGGGTGRVATTVLGVAGGAVLGSQFEAGRNIPAQSPQSVFRIAIDLDHGGRRVLDVPDTGDLRIGDRVRLSPEGFISRL